MQLHLQWALFEQKEKGIIMKENVIAKVPCGKLASVTTDCLSLKKIPLASKCYKWSYKIHKIQTEIIKASELAFWSLTSFLL